MASYDRRTIVGGAPATTLSSGIGSGDTSIVIAAATGWPDSTNGDFFIVLDRGNSAEEKVRCASRSGTTITVQTAGRGSDGTSAAAHAAGVSVEHCITAVDANEANYAVSKTVGKVAAAGDLLYGDAANSLAKLAKGTSGQFLKQGASLPSWASLTSADMSDLAETIRDTMGTALVAGTGITVTVSDGADTITLTYSGTSSGISDFAEAVADTAGAMVTGNTETGIAVTYQDGDNTIDFVVGVDGATTEINGSNQVGVKDGGIGTTQLADGGVTIAKAASGLQFIRTATSAPSSPVVGQQWYDTDDDNMYVYNSSGVWVCLTPQSASVLTGQTTSSTSYTNLATSGPAVTLLTGTTALVSFGCLSQNNVGVPAAIVANFMSVAVSGATTLAASDANALAFAEPETSFEFTMARTYKMTGLTPGSNTFTAKYRVSGSTGTFDNRDITVVGLP